MSARAAADVLAGEAPVGAPASARPAGATWPASLRTSSCMNTVSKPGGMGAPVKMRTAVPAGRRLDRRGAGGDPPDDRQRGLAARLQIGEAHRVSVDGGLSNGREVEGRGDILRQHAAVRVEERHASRVPTTGRQSLVYERPRLHRAT